MSDRSTADRHIARAAEQRARSPVLSQAGNEKYATGCGNLSMPSNHLDRQNKTQKLIKKNTNNIKNVIKNEHFSIGTINLQTAKEEFKLAEYVMHVKNNKFDICLFQETHKTGNDVIDFTDPVLKGWRVIYSGFKKKAQAGVAIVCAPHVTVEDEIFVKEGRIVAARVIVNGTKLSIFSCYSPTDTKTYSDSTKDAFYSTLSKSIKSIKSEHPSFKLIVGGDFNATVGNDCEPDKWTCVGNNHDPDPTSENGLRLLKFCKEHELFMMNSFFGRKNIHRWSFYSNLGYKRRLDYIFCEWYVKRFTNNCRVYRSVSKGFQSDHRVVIMNCAFPSRKMRKQVFSKKNVDKSLHCNIKSLKLDEDVVKSYSSSLDEMLKDCSNFSDVNELSEKITLSIQSSSKTHIPPKKRSSDVKPWVNETFLRLIEDRNRCKKDDDWRILDKEVKKLRDKLKNGYFKKKADAINLASEARDVEEEFRLAKNHTSLNKSKKLLIAPEKLTSHFEQHFSPRPVTPQPEILNPDNFPHILPPDDINVNEDIPNEDELHKVIRKQKDNKCQGIDKIYSEHLKYSKSSKLFSALLLLLTMIWTTVEVPKSWLDAVITCLHKKGLKSVAKNYRSIFIMNAISRILPRLIIERLRDCYESLIMENQFGFRQNRSTTDAIFIVREAIKSTKNPLYLCMIDLRAAYDHVDRDMLFSVLNIRTKAPKITSLLKALYTGTKASIKNTVHSFQVHTGCRQGGIESPVLFNIYMDFVLRCVEHEVLLKYPNTGLKYSYRIKSESSNRKQRSIHKISGNDRLRMLLYADDIVLFCEDINELNDILSIYDSNFLRFGLTIAIDKTQTLAYNVSEEIMSSESLISLRGEPIDNVRTFKYLGHVLCNDPSESSAFLIHQISSAYAKWNEMKSIFLDKRIFLSTRVKFLEACVRSRLLYSVQAWQLGAEEMRKLESVWCGFLRRLVKGGFSRINAPKNKKDKSIPEDEINWSFKLSNEDIRTITKTTEIKNFCDMQHLKYIAHVTRRENNSLQKRFLFCETSKTTSRKWKKFAELTLLDESQLRRTMFDKIEFQKLLSKTKERLDSESNPKRTSASNG